MRLLNIFFLILAGFYMLVLASCGSGSSDGGNDDTPPPGSSLNCDAILATTDIAEPFDVVELLNAGNVNQDSFYVHVDGINGAETIAPLYQSTDGKFTFITPIHPNGSPAGGSVQLTVTDGQTSCSAIGFTIQSLPQTGNDNLLQDIWSKLVADAEQLYQLAGTDSDTLTNTPLDELPAEHVTLALLAELITNFDVDAEYAKLDQQSLDLLLAVLAKLEILDRLAASTMQSRVATARLPNYGSELTASSAAATEDASYTTLPRALSTGECTTIPGGQGDYALDTPAQLASLMEQALQEKAELADTRTFAQGARASLTGLSASTPDVRAKAIIVAASATIMGIELKAISDTLDKPDQLSRLDFGLDNSSIEEDWDTEVDGEIRWSTAKLWATSSGGRYNGPAGDSEEIPDGFENQLPPPNLSPSEQAVQDRMNELDPAAGKVNCVQILPFEYGPVNVPDGSGEEWVTAIVLGEPAISLNAADKRLIEPNRIGASTLRVYSKTGAFPGIIVYADRPVSVLQKLVQWITPTVFVDTPGNQYQASFRISNARHAEKSDLVVEPGKNISIDVITGSAGDFDVFFTTPPLKDANGGSNYPNTIDVFSTSKELPPAEPARRSTLEITTSAKVSIDNAGEVCVAAGEPYDLTATFDGPQENPAFKWTVKTGPGSMSGDFLLGTYSSLPGDSGNVTVRIELEDDPEVSDEFSFRVGNCLNLSVFYQFDGSYILPGIDGNCDVLVDGFDEFEIRNDNVNNDGKNPEIPLDSVWVSGQKISINEVLGSTEVRGTPDEQGGCALGSFPADLMNASTISVADNGDTINYDVDLTAHAVCDTFSNGQADCSSADTTTNVYSVYELDIKEAIDYQLQANLVCAMKDIPGFSNVYVAVFRFDSSENPVPINSLEYGIYVPLSCNSSTTVNFDQTVHFDAPAVSGTTDRAVVQFITVVTASANPDNDGITEDISSMDGSVRVREVSN